MKKAAQRSKHNDAANWFGEGYETIVSLIEETTYHDPHPYHILGSQTLAWVHAGDLSDGEIKVILGTARNIVKGGLEKHPRDDELKQLYSDIEREWLMTNVSPDRRG